jgi:hypothetical protein
LAGFAGHQKLWRLRLDDTKIGDEAVDSLLGMPSLRQLYIAGTEITDAGLLRLGKHKSLISIDLSRTAVTAAGINALLRTMPAISGLDLDELSIDDDDLDAFVASRAPRPFQVSLSLRKTRVTQAAVARLRERVVGNYRIVWEP